MPHATARLDTPSDATGARFDARMLLALAAVPGVGPARVRALLDRFGDATSVMRADVRALAEVEGIGLKTARAIAGFDGHAAIDSQLQQGARLGADLVTCADGDYPARLRELYDPPPFLWLRGTLTEADRRAVAIVG
ncbi:MAG: helix-hairpin-helix domain-containing protein, partial [Bacteroidota bacterium]